MSELIMKNAKIESKGIGPRKHILINDLLLNMLSQPREGWMKESKKQK